MPDSKTSRPFKELADAMTPESRARAEAKAATIERDIAKIRSDLPTGATIGEVMERMRTSGWMFVPPDFLIQPRSRNEALAMKAIGEQYLKDHPHD